MIYIEYIYCTEDPFDAGHTFKFKWLQWEEKRPPQFLCCAVRTVHTVSYNVFTQ